MQLRKTLTIAGLGLLLGLGAAAGASAAPAPTHRMEVNHRLARESHRITRAEREGKITPAKAQALRVAVHAVRRHERMLARRDHGLTMRDTRHLNHAENKLSHKI